MTVYRYGKVLKDNNRTELGGKLKKHYYKQSPTIFSNCHSNILPDYTNNVIVINTAGIDGTCGEDSGGALGNELKTSGHFVVDGIMSMVHGSCITLDKGRKNPWSNISLDYPENYFANISWYAREIIEFISLAE
uniref:Peptidase S1 domain-containing protein n=1 Tax=Rhabditophanes sp. KR3021 TaxID=114890 RepID=A0AC35U557_9BILA